MILRARLIPLLLLAALGVTCAAAAGTILWKPMYQVILTLGGSPPKTWSVYRAEKQNALVLVKLWRRYLLLDLREQTVYDLDPQKMKMVGEALEWSEADKPATPIVISDWSTRDIGPAERIRFRFGSSGDVLELEIPQMPGMRPLH